MQLKVNPTGRTLIAASLLALFTTPASANLANPSAPISQYDACLKAIEQTPEQGLKMARAWLDAGGTTAAEHCEALALANLGRLQESAQLFLRIGQELSDKSPETASEAYLQAAASFQSLGENKSAIEAINQAIALMGTAPDLMTERAQARLLAGDPRGTIEDATTALSQSPNNVEALLLRSAAWRLLGSPDAALSDASQALALAPHNPDVLLEHGLAAFGTGSPDRAKADFSKALQLAQQTGASDTAVAEAAENYLLALDDSQ